MDLNELRKAVGETQADRFSTLLDKKMGHKRQDKFRGCLIGGAAGDALGYAVEFWDEGEIFARFGKPGITEYLLTQGSGLISDDTQMTLFTANGLIYDRVKAIGSPVGCVAQAYAEWYLTQFKNYPAKAKHQITWLLNDPRLYARRAPGNTCLSAIHGKCEGTVEMPINDSKGCGGVMRVAPVGLFYGESNLPGMTIDLMAADIAALTHGHPMGFIPAAMLAHIVRLVSHSDEISLKDAVLDSMTACREIFADFPYYVDTYLKLIEKAIVLSEGKLEDLDAIHILGEGWCGDEALAIAIYCALKYADDFEKAVVASVNHRGDSDSTGAITGNILGAYLGLAAIPQKYVKNLELLDVISQIADDLYFGSANDETALTEEADGTWKRKYTDLT